MPRYQIEASEDIFHAWERLSNEIKELAVIVQNDMTINGNEVYMWGKSASDKLSDFEGLISKTSDHVISHPIVAPDEPAIWIVLATTEFTVIRVRLNESMLQAEAEAVGRESCEAHNFQFHGVYSEEDIQRAESELDIPF